MNLMKVVIVGYGNIGRHTLEAVKASKDFSICGIIRREGSSSSLPTELAGIPVVDHIDKLSEKPQVALLCVPTREVESQAIFYLSRGIHTVDSFDIHTKIWDLHCALDQVAKKNNAVAVISAGWDPGSDSVVRSLLEACAPKGITETNFGPGMSMGHSVAAKSKPGVKAALSMTIPLGTGLHRRNVYIELEEGYSFEEVRKSILEDDYFSHDETHIIAVDCVEDLMDKGHGVELVRHGVSGETSNQRFSFEMKIDNPALTSQIMISCARACFLQQPGSYTMPEIPVINLLPGSLESKIKRLV